MDYQLSKEGLWSYVNFTFSLPVEGDRLLIGHIIGLQRNLGVQASKVLMEMYEFLPTVKQYHLVCAIKRAVSSLHRSSACLRLQRNWDKAITLLSMPFAHQPVRRLAA